MITSVDVLYPICSIQLTRPNAIAMAIIIIQPTPDHKRKSKKQPYWPLAISILVAQPSCTAMSNNKQQPTATSITCRTCVQY